MPTREQVYTAIRNADAAGDSDGVRKLGEYLKTMPADTVAPPSNQVDTPAARPGYFENLKAATEKAGAADLQHPMQAVPGMLEAGLNAVTSGLSPLPGAVTAIAGRLGLDPENPTGDYEKAKNFYVYEPRTESGKARTEQLGAALRPVGDALSYAGDKSAQLAKKLGAPDSLVTDVKQGVPDILGLAATKLPVGFKAAKEGAANLVEKATQSSNASPAAQLAQSKGLSVLPSQAGKTVGGIVEKLAGRPELERQLSIKNAPVIDNVAKRELGIDESKPLTEESIAQVKSKANQAYDAVAKTGNVTASDAFRKDVASITDQSGADSFPEDTSPAVQRLKDSYSKVQAFDAGDAVAKIRQLRADASKNMRAPNAPEQNALGRAQRKISDALDSELQRHVESIGQPALVDQYKQARVTLAKAHTIEDALDGDHLDLRQLAKQADRLPPGELKTAADLYSHFDRVFQNPNKVRSNGPFGAVDYFLGLGGAMHNPLLAAGIAARPLARSAMASDLYQGLRSTTAPPPSFAVPSRYAAGASPIAPAIAAESMTPQERRKLIAAMAQ